MERLRQWDMKNWPMIMRSCWEMILVPCSVPSFLSHSAVLFLKCSKEYIHEGGQMDSAKLTFFGLKVTERQFTCSVKWGGIVLKDCEMLCWWQFALDTNRNCLYCCKRNLQSALLNTISKNYADRGAIRAHVSKLVGGVFWLSGWLLLLAPSVKASPENILSKTFI